MRTLSSDVVAQLITMQEAVAARGVRYRVYAFLTNDQRVMYQLAQYVNEAFDGSVLDVLDNSLTDGSLIGVAPMALVDWITQSISDNAPRALLHVDAVLSTWRSPADHRVWWTQMAMLERPGPLYVLSARQEAKAVARWGRVGSFWVNTAEVAVWAPSAAQHYNRLSQEAVQ